MRSSRPSPVLLLLAAVIGVTVVVPDWITVPAFHPGGHRYDLFAGLWGTTNGGWDDMRVDFDIFGIAYLAFVVSVVGVVLLARAAINGQPAARVVARKAMQATLAVTALFLARMLIETGVGLYWAGVVGPLAMIGAFLTLRDAKVATTSP